MLSNMDFEQKLRELQETQSKLHKIFHGGSKPDVESLAKSYGVPMDEKIKNA